METAYLSLKVPEQADSKASGEQDEITRFLWSELAWIERIQARIMTAQRRFDEIMRELHRHRFMQNQTRRLPEPTQVEDDKPMIAGTLVTTAPHDE